MKSLAILVIFVSIVSCTNRRETPKNEEKPLLEQDSSKEFLKEYQTIIDAGQNPDQFFGKGHKPWQPDEKDIIIAEIMLDACFKTENGENENLFLNRSLDDYNRQFVGAVNSKGEKIIWINCFCKKPGGTFRDWKTNIVGVDGGGNCFFSVKVNLDLKYYYDLMVNGII